MINRYEDSICQFDAELLKDDEYTFSVVIRSLGDPCTLGVTDEESFLILYTRPPYPVWIWTSGRETEETRDLIWRICREEFPVEKGFCFNMKYETAEYFIARGAKENLDIQIRINMFAYDCPEAIPPQREVLGSVYTALERDTDTVVDFMEQFHTELKVDIEDRAAYREKAKKLIELGELFFWKDPDGEPAAMCAFQASGDKAAVHEVYTLPSKRRNGYAENLIYKVTEKIISLGLTPLLYTDADYIASNSCYVKVGYRLRGSLCTVGYGPAER